jgi:hypothetical protein
MRSLARAIFINFREEHMPWHREILGRDLWAQKVSRQQGTYMCLMTGNSSRGYLGRLFVGPVNLETRR